MSVPTQDALEAVTRSKTASTTSPHMLRRHGAGLCALAIALILPLVAQSFLTFQFTLVLVYAIAIIGLNLLTGFNGQFSLGHSAFYAIGAYTAAILMDKIDMPYVLTLPIAGIIC